MFTLKSLVSIVSVTALVAAVPVPPKFDSTDSKTPIYNCPSNGLLALRIHDAFMMMAPHLDIPMTNAEYCAWVNTRSNIKDPVFSELARDLRVHLLTIRPEIEPQNAKWKSDFDDSESGPSSRKGAKPAKQDDFERLMALDGDEDEVPEPENISNSSPIKNKLQRQNGGRNWWADEDGLLVPHNTQESSKKQAKIERQGASRNLHDLVAKEKANKANEKEEPIRRMNAFDLKLADDERDF